MSIVLLAMILDRPALTMRNVALAALLILLITPASLFDPSFEMSFAAVVGLVSLVEANSKRVDDRAQNVSFLWRGMRRLWAIAVADVMTTLVATAAVAPFAIYHFHGFTASTTGCSPRARSPRRGLPHRRYRHRTVQRRQRVQHGSGGGRPRGAVDQERKRGRDARTEALGAGACQVEAVSIGWSGLCRDPGASDDDDDDDDAKHRLFDGNPDE